MTFYTLPVRTPNTLLYYGRNIITSHVGLWERQHCILKCLFQPQNGRSKTQCSDETCNFEVKKKLDPVCRFCCFVLEEKDRKLVLPLVPWNYPLCEDGAGGEGCVCVGGGGGQG